MNVTERLWLAKLISGSRWGLVFRGRWLALRDSGLERRRWQFRKYHSFESVIIPIIEAEQHTPESRGPKQKELQDMNKVSGGERYTSSRAFNDLDLNISVNYSIIASFSIFITTYSGAKQHLNAYQKRVWASGRCCPTSRLPSADRQVYKGRWLVKYFAVVISAHKFYFL